MTSIFKKVILTVMTAALVLAAFPVTSAYARDENPPSGKLITERLERAWVRELKTYERIGRGFANVDSTIARFQARLDRAVENGKDVTALQAALGVFETALTSAEPIYEGMSEMIRAHTGFDTNGKVTDVGQAKSTVKEVGAKLKEIKFMGGTGKALHQALKAFREANKAAERDS
jgi:hypothetical protein